MRHRESDLQIACVRWFTMQYPQYRGLLFAVPNGGSRNRIEAARMKAEGTVAGVSDLILLVPRGHFGALCIELKTENGQIVAGTERMAAMGRNERKQVCGSTGHRAVH